MCSRRHSETGTGNANLFLFIFSGKENWQEKEDECQVLQLESLLERVLCFPYWWNGYETSLLGCNGMYLKVEISQVSKKMLRFWTSKFESSNNLFRKRNREKFRISNVSKKKLMRGLAIFLLWNGQNIGGFNAYSRNIIFSI